MTRSKIKGVPQVWITMTAQSYNGVRLDRYPDGTLKWKHRVVKGYDANKQAITEVVDDVGHKDPKSWNQTLGEFKLVGRDPIRLHADIAAGLMATQQADWCVEKNEEYTFEEIMEAFCPVEHRDSYLAYAEATA